MSEEIPPTKPPEPKPTPGPLVPRPIITFVFLVLVGAMIYSASRSDYKSMIVSALVILFILGADLGALLRGWRGGG